MKRLLLIIVCVIIILGDIYPQNWFSQSSNVISSLRSVYFKTYELGWAVGFNGAVLKTTNSGNIWTTQVSGTSNKLYSIIYFTDDNNGWIAGEFGLILKSTDGGGAWAPVSSGTNKLLRSAFFSTATDGFICGNDGTILKTNNSGNNWSIVSTGISEDLKTIYFPTADTGFTAGFDGVILKTTDRGVTWVAKNSSTLQELNSIFFIDSQNGWAAGNSGTILATTNGGESWVSQSAGTSEDLNSIRFVDELNGWSCGSTGSILKTTDGGANWVSEISGTSFNLFSVFFANHNNGWVVGDNGTILKKSVKLNMIPSDTVVHTNDTIKVEFSVDNITGLFAASATVGFDNNLLDLVKVEQGSFLSQNPSGFNVFYEQFPDSNYTDSVEVDQAIMGYSSVSGTGMLFRLSFIPKRIGTAAITLKNIRFRDINNIPISFKSDTVYINIDIPTANVKIFLQGPYSSGTMNVSLSNVIPLAQPFSTPPWNYSGEEKVPSGYFQANINIVDWVLVEIRSNLTTTAARRAGLLLKNGLIVDLDGTTPLSFFIPNNTEYYIVVKHRNHIPVMSSVSMFLTSNSVLYNFTNSITKAYGIQPQVEVAPGIFGIYGGDANGDGYVTGTDFNIFSPEFRSGTTGYSKADFNMDGFVTGTDFNLFSPQFRSGRNSQLP